MTIGRPKTGIDKNMQALLDIITANEGVHRTAVLSQLKIDSAALQIMTKRAIYQGHMVAIGNGSSMRYYTADYAAIHGHESKDRTRTTYDPDPIHSDWVNRNKIFAHRMKKQKPQRSDNRCTA